jgi:hypothetical protein
VALLAAVHVQAPMAMIQALVARAALPGAPCLKVRSRDGFWIFSPVVLVVRAVMAAAADAAATVRLVGPAVAAAQAGTAHRVW